MKRILIYGDSLTYGFDPRGLYESRYPESIRWTDVLTRRLMETWEVFVDAANGREIPTSKREIEIACNAIRETMPLNLFAVMLGHNDYLTMYQPDVVEVTAHMKRFLEEVMRLDEVAMCGTKILLMCPPAIHTLQDEFYAKYDTTNGIFSKAYGALASHLGIEFVDTNAWDVPCAFDGVHLAEEANELFADRMEELLLTMGLQMDMEIVG